MAKYRKKPVEVEAVEWTGKQTDIMDAFIEGCEGAYYAWYLNEENGELWIPTSKLIMKASVGDFIVKKEDGEFYPCKPEIFHKTYEKVEESNTVPTGLSSASIIAFTNDLLEMKVAFESYMSGGLKDTTKESVEVQKFINDFLMEEFKD